MKKYSIYCTESQTLKALKLGAPIKVEVDLFFANIENLPTAHIDEDVVVVLPTAEQMVSWIEEQGVIIEVSRYLNRDYWCFFINNDQELGDYSRKDATLHAIDMALGILDNKSRINES